MAFRTQTLSSLLGGAGDHTGSFLPHLAAQLAWVQRKGLAQGAEFAVGKWRGVCLEKELEGAGKGSSFGLRNPWVGEGVEGTGRWANPGRDLKDSWDRLLRFSPPGPGPALAGRAGRRHQIMGHFPLHQTVTEVSCLCIRHPRG